MMKRPSATVRESLAPYALGMGLLLAAAALLVVQGDDVLSGFVRLIEAPWVCL